MPINHFHILGIAVVVVLSIWLLDRWCFRRRATRFRGVAREMKVRYSPVDRFNIAPRIAPGLPDPGAADVLVRDLMYRTTQRDHDYVFTVIYTVGSIGGTRRKQRVAAASEPHGRSCDSFGDLRFADASLSVRAQYESLVD